MGASYFKRVKPPTVILLVITFLLASCGGSGGGGSDDDDFPTPTLPADARTINAGNAEDTADSALSFSTLLAKFAPKTEGPPTAPQVLKQVTDRIVIGNRNSGSVAARETENLSASFCDTGSATDSYTETETSIEGELTFADCDFGSGVIVNGRFPYEGSFNEATLDFSLQFGGTLTIQINAELVTIVMNSILSGNDGTGAFSVTQSFSMQGIPGGGFLVTTVLPIQGNSFSDEITRGELSVQGANNTKLCITVTAINLATVEFDDGLGAGCMPLVPPLDIPI